MRVRAVGHRAAWMAATVGMLATVGALVATARSASATPSTGFDAIDPVLIVDTRVTPGSRLQPGTELNVPVSPAPGGSTRAAVRITATDTVGVGELRVHPCGAYDPAGRVQLELTAVTDTALVFAPLQSGAFCLHVTAPTQVIIDLEGYESPGGATAFVATGPSVAMRQVSVLGGTTQTLPLGSLAGVPAGAVAVSAAVTATGTSAGYVTLYPCGTTRPLASTLLYPGDARPWATAAIGRLDAGQQLCVYASSTSVVSVLVYGYWAPGAPASATGPLQYAFDSSDAPGFVGVNPTRLFDTRSTGARVGGGQVYELDLSSRVPADATDVVMNVTVTDPTAGGFVTVYPCEVARPVVSNLNFVAGQTVPNLVTVSLGSDARICLYSNVPTHLLSDLAGWYQTGGGDGYLPVTPSRLFDTRSGSKLGAGATYTLDLSGTVGADTSAVVLNVTVTETGSAGFVTVYPCSSPRPTASNLNYVVGQTVPNLVTVAVGSDRRVCFYTSGPAHMLADIAGWYASSSTIGYIGLVPARLFDTRDSVALEAGDILKVPYGPGVAPGATGDAVVALVMNVTAVAPAGPGFVTAYPCESGVPTVSNVNYVKGDVVPNLSIVRVDTNDDVCFYTLTGTHLLADLAGYFTSLPVLDLVEVR